MTIVERILPVYNRNYPRETRDVIWNYMMDRALKVDLTEANLYNMGDNALSSGFCGAYGQKEIVKLAEALGVCGISNPENDAAYKRHVPAPVNVEGMTSDEILDKIQGALPFQINFPPFYANCTQGVFTKYGAASNRHIFYLWVLKRIMELCPDPNSGILEIGAGFGLLGYYLDKVGYKDYTTIDLALINACQTYFLAKNLPEREIIISGDTEDPFSLEYRKSIKLLHASEFVRVPENRFSIMVNMDGLTEMGVEQATRYTESDCAPMLLSINHEVNPYRVCDLKQPRTRKYRYPFWLREGYVEELYV